MQWWLNRIHVVESLFIPTFGSWRSRGRVSRHSRSTRRDFWHFGPAKGKMLGSRRRTARKVGRRRWCHGDGVEEMVWSLNISKDFRTPNMSHLTHVIELFVEVVNSPNGPTHRAWGIFAERRGSTRPSCRRPLCSCAASKWGRLRLPEALTLLQVKDIMNHSLYNLLTTSCIKLNYNHNSEVCKMIDCVWTHFYPLMTLLTRSHQSRQAQVNLEVPQTSEASPQTMKAAVTKTLRAAMDDKDLFSLLPCAPPSVLSSEIQKSIELRCSAIQFIFS